ncbi:MAG: hypothetical protein K9N06_04815 [Candidatus Cloacimonetes bacterium]|nr:hypothetical protein [Candidatus Cloacimonadota bacterium]
MFYSMKRLTFTIIVFLVYLTLFGQDADSLQVLSPEDSLLIQQLEDETGIYEQDTLKIDLVKLRRQITEELDSRLQPQRKEWFRWWYLSENRHYTSLKQPVLHIRKEGFTMYPHFVESLHILQSERSFYKINSYGHHLNLDSYDYDLPITLSSSEAGLGDWHHSRGSLVIEKGNTPLSDSLAFSAGVSGINGYWFGNDDSSANLNFNLRYRTPWGNIRFIHSDWSEEFDGALSFLPEADIVTRSGIEEIIKFEHSAFEAGLRLENTKTAGIERKQQAFLLRREHSGRLLHYDLSAEYITEKTPADSSWLVFSAQADGNLLSLKYNLDLNYSGKNIYFIDTELFLPFYKSIGITGNAWFWKNDSTSINPVTGQLKRYGAGLAWRDSLNTLEITGGNQEDDSYDDWYLETYANCTFSWKQFDLILKNWTFYFINPNLQSQTEAELRYRLPYNNALRLQYRNRYYSEYLNRYDEYIPSGIWHDLLIGVQITRRFEIRFEAVNITNNLIFMGQQQAGYTMLYNLYWYFIN